MQRQHDEQKLINLQKTLFEREGSPRQVKARQMMRESEQLTHLRNQRELTS